MKEYWHCTVCTVYYDEKKGAPSDGVPPNTPWQWVPADWVCPGCGLGKEYYEKREPHPVSSVPAD